MTNPILPPVPATSPSVTPGQPPAHVDSGAWHHAVGQAQDTSPKQPEHAARTSSRQAILDAGTTPSHSGRTASSRPQPVGGARAGSAEITKDAGNGTGTNSAVLERPVALPVTQRTSHSRSGKTGHQAGEAADHADINAQSDAGGAAISSEEFTRPAPTGHLARATDTPGPGRGKAASATGRKSTETIAGEAGGAGAGQTRSTLDHLKGRLDETTSAAPRRKAHAASTHATPVSGIWPPGTMSAHENQLPPPILTGEPRRQAQSSVGNVGMRAAVHAKPGTGFSSRPRHRSVAVTGLAGLIGAAGAAGSQAGSPASSGGAGTGLSFSSASNAVGAPLAASSPASLASAMTGMITSQTQSARITLHPESLGQVSVVLQTAASGKVDVRLMASSQAGHDLIVATKPLLAAHLAGTGLSVGLITVQQPGAAQQSGAAGGNASFSSGQGATTPFGQGGAGGQGGFSGNGNGGHPTRGSPRLDSVAMPPHAPETDDTVTAYA